MALEQEHDALKAKAVAAILACTADLAAQRLLLVDAGLEKVFGPGSCTYRVTKVGLGVVHTVGWNPEIQQDTAEIRVFGPELIELDFEVSLLPLIRALKL